MSTPACARASRVAVACAGAAARVCTVSSSSAVSAVAHAHASTLHGAHNSGSTGGLLPVQRSTSYCLDNSWSETVRVQGPTGARRVKGGVSGPAEDLLPVSEVKAGVNFRPAGGVRGQVAGSIPWRQPGTGTWWYRVGAVTPSLHPEVLAWNEKKALPLPRFSGLAILLELVETTGIWLQGLLDAYIAVIPKADGDSTPLGQRHLSVLPVVYRLWASLRLGHLREWVEGWLPRLVFSLGNGLSSVAALDIEEVLSGTGSDQLHVMVADVIKSFDTVDRSILDCVLGRLGLPDWFRKVFFLFIVRFVFGLSLLLGLVNRGVEMVVFTRAVL